MRDVISRDQEQREKLVALQSAITQGLESGVSKNTIDGLWLELKIRHSSVYEISKRALDDDDAILEYTVVSHGGAQAHAYYNRLKAKLAHSPTIR